MGKQLIAHPTVMIDDTQRKLSSVMGKKRPSSSISLIKRGPGVKVKWYINYTRETLFAKKLNFNVPAGLGQPEMSPRR